MYNTEQQIRDALGMPASTPTSAQITRWCTLIDKMITNFNSSPDSDIAAIIELNKIGVLWNAKKRLTNDGDWKGQDFSSISLLTPDEKDMLDDDVRVDSIPMNGKREWDII